MFELIEKIQSLLRVGEDFVLATITDSSGSTPRTAGSKMIVREDGSIFGTIGGGFIEGDVIAAAGALFTTQTAEMREYDLGFSGNAEQMDLICGGRMEVLLEYVPANSQNKILFSHLQKKMKKPESFFWLGRKCQEKKNFSVTRKVVSPEGLSHDGETLPPGVIRQLKELTRRSNKTLTFQEADEQYMVELIEAPATVILVGGGHVSIEIARLSKASGFKVAVVDDRPEFASKERFPEADRIVVCPEYHEVFDKIEVNQSCYIVIVTRGHLFDKEALAQALQTDACYVGMIGSRKKRDSIYEELLENGFNQESLKKVYCPIGLEINAETPFEIGISVVSQLIKHRADLRKNGPELSHHSHSGDHLVIKEEKFQARE